MFVTLTKLISTTGSERKVYIPIKKINYIIEEAQRNYPDGMSRKISVNCGSSGNITIMVTETIEEIREKVLREEMLNGTSVGSID